MLLKWTIANVVTIVTVGCTCMYAPPAQSTHYMQLVANAVKVTPPLSRGVELLVVSDVPAFALHAVMLRWCSYTLSAFAAACSMATIVAEVDSMRVT